MSKLQPTKFKVAKCDLERTTQIQELKRNLRRFPKDFAFQLTLVEAKSIAALRSQNVTLRRGHHIKHPPHVFTEHGAIMLASVLSSPAAIQATIYVVRAFVKMRTAVQEYAELSRRIDELAANCDDRFGEIFHAIRLSWRCPSGHRELSDSFLLLASA